MHGWRYRKTDDCRTWSWCSLWGDYELEVTYEGGHWSWYGVHQTDGEAAAGPADSWMQAAKDAMSWVEEHRAYHWDRSLEAELRDTLESA